MKRSRIIALLRIVVVVLVFAAPAIARPEAASAGFTWDQNAATTTGIDDAGWTWDENAPTDGVPAEGAGWTWDENAPTDGVPAEGAGWTWDENAPTDGVPAEGAGWTSDDDASSAPSDAAVTEPAP
jgi:hypothetical protein